MRNQRLHLHELDVSRARKAVDHTSERGEFYNHSPPQQASLNRLSEVSRKFKHEDNADCRRSDKKQPSFYNHALRATVQMAGSHNLTKALHAHDGEGCTQMAQAVPQFARLD